jgi:hypothetical protein
MAIVLSDRHLYRMLIVKYVKDTISKAFKISETVGISVDT